MRRVALRRAGERRIANGDRQVMGPFQRKRRVDVCDVQALDPVNLISHDKVLVTVGALKKLEEALA